MLMAIAPVAVTVGGCMVGPKYARPALEPPAAFASPAPGGEPVPIPEDWWRLYREPALDALIATANASNQTLRQAVARVDQARALARVAASYRLPTVALGPIASRQRTSGDRPSPPTEAPVAQQQDGARARADEAHALAILCGQPAPSFSVPVNPLQQGTPPAVPPGLPAAVLSRRPDIAEAEQNLIAANALVGVATADL